MAAEDIGETELPLPKGWIKSISKKFDKPYYYHENTKCSIWVHPALLCTQQDVRKDTEESLGKSTSFSRSNQSFPGKKAYSSSTIMDFLGLSGTVIGNQRNEDNNGGDTIKEVVTSKGTTAPFTREQRFLLLGRKTQSASELQDFHNLSDNLIGSRIQIGNSKFDDKVRERSPIKSKQNSTQPKIFGEEQIRTTKSPEKKLNKTNPFYNHQLQKYKRKGIYETVDTTEPNNHFHKLAFNTTSSNHTSKLPRLKPLSPKPTNVFKQNRKRHGMEIINRGDDQQESYTKCKIMKTYNKETYDNNNSSNNNNNNNNKNNNNNNISEIVTNKILTPAMKDVVAKRESVKIVVNHRKELVKSSAKKIGKRILEKSKEIVTERFTKPTPAMIAVVKKCQLKILEEKQKKQRPIHTTFNDNETKVKKKKTKKKSKSKEILSNVVGDEDVVNKILNKSINCVTPRLKPLKPSTKTQNLGQESQTESSLLSAKENTPLLSQNEMTLLDEVEDMEVDEAVHKEITKEIRELREDNVFEKPCIGETDKQHVLPFYSEPLYIVLDTNVLLGNLKFVSELKDYPIPGVGPPILVIPWMVFQELDSLKDAGKRYHVERNADGVDVKSHALSTLARKAINFIGGCLDGEHPRLKGQSAIEAGTPIKGFVEENNDDSIIHCALGLKTRSIHSHVVLLSNDRNLCNKSIVSSIKAFSHQNILSGLKNIFKNETVIAPKYDFTNVTTSSALDDLTGNFIAVRKDLKVKQAEDVVKGRRADEFSCELQCILRDNFSKIIETEMMSAYGNDLWLNIVKIKPPWTLEDIFVLLEKHWIAVFGCIVSRHLNKTISKLKDMYLSAKTSPVTLKSTKIMLQLSLAILSGFQAHSDYNGMLQESVKHVHLLLNKSNELNLNMPETSSSVQSPDHVKLPEPNVCNKEVSSYEKVRITFDEIWNTANHYSALIFSSLNFPSPLTIDPEQGIPSSQESLLCLSVLIPCIFKLIKSIHNLVSTPETDSSNAQQNVINLLESIYTFSKEVMKRDCTMLPHELLEFCKTSSTRDVFVQGLSQLDRLYAMLQQCDKFHKS